MKLFINNRQSKRLAVIVDKPDNPKGLAFVLHGLGGTKEQNPVVAMAQAFYDNNYIAIRYDASHSVGESEGDYGDANVTNYYQDLEDVIDWASGEDWYQEPFCLAGHSLGAGCVMWYATNHPDMIKALAPLSATTAGKRVIERYRQEDLDVWERTGVQSQESATTPGLIKKLNWHQFKKDILDYDIFPRLYKMSMPLLLAVGENDQGTTVADHQEVYDGATSPNKTLKVIKGAGHDFLTDENKREIYKIFSDWIKHNL